VNFHCYLNVSKLPVLSWLVKNIFLDTKLFSIDSCGSKIRVRPCLYVNESQNYIKTQIVYIAYIEKPLYSQMN